MFHDEGEVPRTCEADTRRSAPTGVNAPQRRQGAQAEAGLRREKKKQIPRRMAARTTERNTGGV